MPKKDHRSLRALAAAERLFKRKPDASTEEFRKVCERADKETISKLDNREFNASYVLPFRRSKALRGKTTKKRTKKKTAKRKTKKKRASKWAAKRGASAHDKIVKMIRERDAEVMAAAEDPQKAYEVAAGVEEFVAELLGK